jgi:hypothetical protein
MRREVSPAQRFGREPDSLTCVKAQCSHTISSWLVISGPKEDGFKWAQDKGKQQKDRERPNKCECRAHT